MAKKKKEKLQWAIEPMKETPLRAALAVFLSIVCSVITVVYIGNILISLPLVLIFVWSLSPLFLRFSYEINTKNVSYQTFFLHKELGWNNFRGAVLSDRSILLTKMKRRSWLDRWHGLVLYVKDKEQGKIAMELIEASLKRYEQRSLRETLRRADDK